MHTMMSDTSTTNSVLNDLIETSKDGEKGFLTAAEDTKNPELKTIFQRRAQDCATSAAALQQLVSGLGAGRVEKTGSVAGAVHRGWVHLKAAATGRSDVAILEECERGEDVAKGRYKKALGEPLPDEIRAVVQRQYEGVIRNHDQIRGLRDSYRAGQA
jgi:uncharacterized protein (TIGR02284 family)